MVENSNVVRVECEGADLLDISSLKVLQGNLKALSKENYAKLKKEILERGFSAPFHVWENLGENYILDGTQRYRTLTQMKSEGYSVPPLPIVWIDAQDVKEAKRKILGLASQYGELSGESLYEYMHDAGIEIEEIEDSFRFPEINIDLFKDEFFEENNVGNSDEDEVPDLPTDTRVRPGDLFILGDHRLLCGDSTNIEDVERLMAREKADMVFTDPPYGIGVDGQKESINKNPKHNRKAHDFRGWDSERPDQGIFNYITGLNIPAVIFGGNYFADWLPASRGWIYWGKGQDGDLTSSDGELAWTNANKPLRAVTVNRAALKGSVHPTQKPIEVVTFCLDYLGELKNVLDLYGGSGSTLIACEKTNRKCFMMEICENYVSVIIERWCKFTGKEAYRINADGTKTAWSSIQKASPGDLPKV